MGKASQVARKRRAEKPFLRRFWKQAVDENHATDVAAQLAFYFMLSIFPFLIFAVTLLGYTNITVADVLGLLRRYLPGDSLSPIQNTLQEVLENRKGGLLSFGILGTIWTASAALSAVINALNRAYGTREDRSFLKSRALAIMLTLMMVLAILTSLLLPVLGEVIRRLISLFIEIPAAYYLIWDLMRWSLSTLVMVAAFICIYYLAPTVTLRIRDVIPGALFAVAGWQLASLGFSNYLNNFANYSATYGSLGAIIALMVWFYLTGLILILGGELNAALKAGGTR
ncbi:MAG: YihY/virulence factor BrkB family protein [Syntrophobacter sp.]